MEYFFDTYAIVECINDGDGYKKFQNEIITTTTLNLCEVYYSILKKFNPETANFIIKKLNLRIIEFDLNVLLEAAKFRHDNYNRKLSYIDCIGYLVAIKSNLKFLTGDIQFEKFENVEFVK